MSTVGSGNKSYKQIGDEIWKKTDKVNGELFALTYGVFVAQLMKDNEDVQQVNAILEKTGYSIGTRLIDELLAKASISQCADLKETSEVVKLAFRIFLNIMPIITMNGDKEFVISLAMIDGGDGVGSEWVELPEVALKGGLHYANMLCGIIRGALEMVHQQVECTIINDPLLNASVNTTDIRVKFIKNLDQELPPNDD